MKKDNTLFDTLHQITVVQDPNFLNTLSEEQLKSLSPFILNKWLGQRQDYIVFADYMCSYIFDIPIDRYYKIAISCIDKVKGKAFFKWVKNKKQSDKVKFLIDIIIAEYGFLSKKEAEEYLEILMKDTILLVSIVKKYPIEDKDLKKIGLKRSDLFGKEKQVKKVSVIEPEPTPEKDIWEGLF